MNKANLNISFERSYHGILRKAIGNAKLILPGVRAVVMNDSQEFLFTRRRSAVSFLRKICRRRQLYMPGQLQM